MTAKAIAQEWANLGVAAIPVRYRNKKPAVQWHKYIERLPTQHEIDAWFLPNGYGVAVVTGWEGLSVIDFDNVLAHARWMAALPRSLAQVVLTTFRVRTRNGIHIYIKSDEVAATRCFKSHNLGYDTRGPGGYAITSPSVHPTGFIYTPIGRPRDVKRIESIYELLPEARDLKPTEQAAALIRKEDSPPPGSEDDFWARAASDYSGESIQQLKERVTIFDLVGIPQPTRRYEMASCPFHHDDHPSMVVYRDGGWRCFVCDIYGDVIDYHALVNNMTTKEAIRDLATRYTNRNGGNK